jgi:hypothetical protein
VLHIGLLHHFQELARIGRQRFDIAPLPFGIDRVERQAGLARAGQAGDHHQAVARQIDVDALEVVFARTTHGEGGQRRASGTGRTGRSGRHDGRCSRFVRFTQACRSAAVRCKMAWWAGKTDPECGKPISRSQARGCGHRPPSAR